MPIYSASKSLIGLGTRESAWSRGM